MATFSHRRLSIHIALTVAGRLASQLIWRRPTRPHDRIWTEVFAWWPVFPRDEHSLFWLETIWRRINPETMRWEYRSFRTDAEKLREAESLRDLPPMIH